MTKEYKKKISVLIPMILLLYIGARMILVVADEQYYNEIYGLHFRTVGQMIFRILQNCLVALGFAVLIPYEYLWKKYKDFCDIWNAKGKCLLLFASYAAINIGLYAFIEDGNYLWSRTATRTAALMLGLWLFTTISIFRCMQNGLPRWIAQLACTLANSFLILKVTRQFIFMVVVLAAELLFLLIYCLWQDRQYFLWKLLAMLPATGLFLSFLIEETNHTWKLDRWLNGELYRIPFADGLFTIDRTKNLLTLTLYPDYLINTFLGTGMLVFYWVLLLLLSVASVYLIVTVAKVSGKRGAVMLAIALLFWMILLYSAAADFGLVPVSSTLGFRNYCEFVFLFLMLRASVMIPVKETEKKNSWLDYYDEEFYDDDDFPEDEKEHMGLFDRLLMSIMADDADEDEELVEEESSPDEKLQDEMQTLRWELKREKYESRRTTERLRKRIAELEAELEKYRKDNE